ncbi:MAG: hypothetical protein FWC26_06965 [Fibromonadales bacterium]|nr:hypothetical protein [Fibromonadales bacterium]
MAYVIRLIPLLLVFAVYGQQQKRIAIINAVDDGEPQIAALELTHLTDRLREIATENLSQRNYAVMTQESIVAFLGSQEEAAKKCRESSCLAQLGKEVNADYVAQGRTGRFGSDLTIKVELYESGKGTMVGSFTGTAKDIYGLLAIINEKSPALFKKLSSGSPSFAGGISSVSSSGNGNFEVEFGILNIKPAYSGSIGENESWNIAIGGKAAASFENILSPNKYSVKLSHRCYEDISFDVEISKGSREIFDMAKHIKLKQGGLALSAERNGEPVNEPVFVNGKQAGETPFIGPVPLCSVIDIGNEREAVNVKLRYNEKIAHKHNMGNMGSQKYDDSYKPEFEQKKSESNASFWVALAFDIVGAAAFFNGYLKDREARDMRDKYRSLDSSAPRSDFGKAWGKVEKARDARDVSFIVGGIFLGLGVGVHICF